MKNKISKIIKEIFNADVSLKMKIISLIFIFGVLIFCLTTFFTTYTEYVSNPSNLNGVIGDTVYINDAQADWYYYNGQNYTNSSNGQLPTFEKKSVYSESNLVEVQVTYSGTDILYNQTGYVSLNEQQKKYVYYKLYPVHNNNTTDTSDDYILIDLIDNPFTDRPNDLAFNGWITTYQGAVVSYDKSFYERQAKVPVTSYTNNKPNAITITFNASWTNATVGRMTGNWGTAFNSLKAVGMQRITTTDEVIDYNYLMDDYYTRVTIARYVPYEGYYSDNGTLYTAADGNCPNRRGCTVYEKMTGQVYNANTTYYGVVYGNMWTVDEEDIPFDVSLVWLSPYSGTTIMAGFYRQEEINYGESLIGYYTNDGTALSGTCSTVTCTYYKLIQYRNGDDIEYANMEDEYYYLVTRDTNIVYMTSSITGAWSTSTSNYTRPFTLTSLHNGTKSNVTWSLGNSGYVICYADIVIENLTINSGTSYTSTSDPASGSTTARFFYGNFYNVKLGRGIARYNNNANFLTVVGGANTTATVGSSSNLKKYKLMVESGFYSSSGLSNTNNSGQSSNGTLYIANKSVYGNDYDRVNDDNTKLIFYYCAGASWRGNHYSSSTTGIIFDLVVKSGVFGTNANYSNMYYAGIYVGAQVGGDTYAAKRIKVEGGDIFNLIGGPLVSSSIKDYNDIYIYMTGGSVDMINGGAGISGTYGNKIIQVTGGTINYAIYGGSNASMSGNQANPGILYGDSYIYVGGNAVVGDPNNLNATLWGTQAGNVFGSGNGQTTSTTRGSNENAYIIIADNAHINRSVYGGGNYGATGGSFTNLNNSTTKIKVLGGTIEGSVYGGGNNNGSGSNDTTSSVTIETTGGTIKNGIYGGSDIKGTVFGSTTINAYGGTIQNGIYGGGRGGPMTGSDGTFVENNTTVTIGSTAQGYSSLPLTVTGSVYGGSAFGTVGNDEITSSATSATSSVTVNRGTIDNVFGGGQGGTENGETYTAYVEGSVHVNIKGGTISNVYGGCDLLGTPKGTVVVDINGGTTGTVYGGGNQASVNNTDVNLNSGTITTVYGGSNQAGGTSTNVALGNGTTGSTVTTIFGGSRASGTIGTSTITASKGSVNTIYGGNDQGTSTGTTNITITGGTNANTFIYGGGKNAPAGTTNVNLYDGTVGTVYGGGEAADVTVKANVKLGNATTGSNTTTIFGGSKSSGVVNETAITATKGSVDLIYGGNDQGTNTGPTTITITGGTDSDTVVYGGGKNAPVATTLVNLNGGTIGTVYGGGEAANVVGNAARTVGTIVNLSGASVTTIYGGSNTTGDVLLSDVNITSGSVGTVYGGNNIGGQTAGSDIDMTGGSVTTAIYGGGYQATTPLTSITITATDNKIPSVFGGGKAAAVTTSASILINGGEYGTIYGGSDQSQTVANGRIELTSLNNATISVDNIYGGNNAGGTTTTTVIDINAGTIGNIYGGGNDAATNTATVDINDTTITGSVYGGGRGQTATIGNTATITIIDSSITGDVFGGGNAGAVTSQTTGDTTVIVTGTTIGGSIYGGGNQADVSGDTSLTINNTSTISGNVFGGGNSGLVGGNTTTNIASSIITLDIYSGGNQAEVTGSTNLTINNTSLVGGNIFGGGNAGAVGGNATTNISTTDVTANVYGGGNQAEVTGSTNLTIDNTSSVGVSVFGGGNVGPVGGNATTSISATDVTEDVYGGGNQAAVTGSTSLTINNISSVGGSIFGGGNVGLVGSNATINISATEVMENVYGGGNQAIVTGNAIVNVTNSSIVNGSVFGGGNAGIVEGNATTRIASSTVLTNTYGGGNTAYVNGNTILNIDGTTSITGNVFGSGNNAGTGLEINNNAISNVNITGGIVGGDVYGGPRTSEVYGTAIVNVGTNAVNNNNLATSNISIAGTVFGGGDSKPVESDVWTFDHIGVKNGATVLIDGSGHGSFDIEGHLFGSGNASSIEGPSLLTVKNYGSNANNTCKKNISIQRVGTLVIDNSCIELEGATDRTNEYSAVAFTLSRIDHLKLKNNSTLYLQTGANLLKHFSSLVDNGNNEVKASVTIANNGSVTKTVDNRLYMWEGKNLNIAVNENITGYGEVDGMTFFGMYNHDRDGNIATAFYNDSFDSGDLVTSSELYYFSNGSYVLGLHEFNHNIRVDGFYSNEENEDNLGTIRAYYIEPTPEDAGYYMWVVGEAVASYTVNLVASKYSTLGAVELPLVNYSDPNTSFSIVGFNYNTLEPGISLVNENQISRIAANGTIADSVMSLVMKTGNTGWITVGSTTFKTDAVTPYLGTIDYATENSTAVPSLFFYLYHSKNLSTAGSMGTAVISLLVVTPIDDLNNEITRLNITVDMSRALYSTNEYEGAVTVGKQYEMFLNSTTNVTTKSSISTYYSLYVESPTTIYQTGYHRSLVSNYVFPENTKITMIDFGSSAMPEYYYYVVSAADVATAEAEFIQHREASYQLSKFVRMGSSSTTNIYDDAAKNVAYYDSVTRMAEEEFIFIVDFSESEITSNQINLSLLIELRNAGNQTLIGVLGIQQTIMLYNLYYNQDAVIDVNGAFSTAPVYRGESVNLNVDTNFIQNTAPSGTIYDTNYFNQKLGIKLSIYDSNNTRVDGYSLLGTYFRLNGIDYHPRVDGTYRINIAERVANVASPLQFVTTNSNLASGSYTVKIESFGSPDGIYYGLSASDSIIVPFTFVNAIYGLSITMPEHNIIVDKETGLSSNGTNLELFHVNYTSSLQNPNLRVSLYRRDYTTEYSTNYVLVDLLDYISNNLDTTTVPKVYKLVDTPIADNIIRIYMKENLMTGTYKIVVGLYDGNSFIGDAHQFIFIK